MATQTSEIKAAPARPYFPELDGIRAIAALMIMAFHFSQFWYALNFIVIGQTGVDLFFVLSGFLITTILLQANPGDWGEVRRFYIRRTLRIFPLYYGYLILSSLLFGTVSACFWVYLENWPVGFHVPVTGPEHFWSLAVEEQFYLVWPFLILFLPRRWLVRVMWAVIGLSFLSRLAVIPLHASSFYLTTGRMDGLAAGGLLAMAQRGGTLVKRRGLLTALGVCSAAVMMAQFWWFHREGAAWVQATKTSMGVGVYVAFVGLVLVTSNSTLHRFLRSAVMRLTGRISYGLYVFNPIVFTFLPPRMGHLPVLLKAVASFAAVFAIAWVSWYGYERRFIEWKDKLAPEPRFVAATVADDGDRVEAPSSGQQVWLS
jgi:peptidoglycan/LPS O-acetylase OafA/YrhL